MKTSSRFFVFMSCVTCVGMVHAASGQSAASPFNYMTFINGTCKKAMINKKDETAICKPVMVNTSFKNGRAMFMFEIGHDLIGFAGSHDNQPTPTHYELEVDELRYDKASQRGHGYCSMDGDPRSAATYICEIRVLRSSAEIPDDFRIEFISSGKPEIIHD